MACGPSRDHTLTGNHSVAYYTSVAHAEDEADTNVFRALADPTRRALLDALFAANGQTLSDLTVGMNMTRQAVTKHLAILEDANLVATIRRGREKLHYLNPVPIHEIGDRWISKYDRARLTALSDLKKALENEPDDEP
jgi:DNA-binding transcriptional ArsR family regulator